MLLHGFTSDAYTWFDRRRGDENEPFLPVTLFNEGYDVWLGNTRGTRYSFTHTSLDAFANDEAFFDYDIEEIARQDIPAMVKLIMDTQAEYKAAGGRTCKKVNFIGHSNGAAIMLAAMSFSIKSDRYVSQMVGIEPCLIAKPDAYTGPIGINDSQYTQLSFGLDMLGIESVFGANWDDQVDLICT